MAELRENLARLQAACDNPRTQLDYYLEPGKKVVGCFAPYTPEELVHASGMIPMGLWGGQTSFQKVTAYLPAFACPIMQANMEFALNGVYEGLSAVIIPAICDTLRCMTQNWRFGVPAIPMIPIVYPQNRTSPASVTYLVDEFESVLTMLATTTGQMMNEKALCRTIETYNEHNAAMRDFAQVANDHLDVVTPKVRHTVFKSAFFFEKGEHTTIVKEITTALKERPTHSWTGKKILLTGIAFEPDEVLDILAENKLAVVGDDLAQESRQYRTDTPKKGGGGLKRLALQWNARRGCSLLHELNKPRGNLLAELCRGVGAQGVLTGLMKFCDPEEYDLPFLENDLRQAGIQCVTVSIDQQSSGSEQLRTRIQSFAELLD